VSADLQPETYEYLRDLAERIHAERGGTPSLQPDGLLHEAWLKLSRRTSDFENRGHFLAVAARAMRQIMIDRARAKLTDKRRVEGRRPEPDAEQQPLDLLAIDALLDDLEKTDPLAAQVVISRVFGGLTALEAAEAQGVSKATADRAWRKGRAFLAESFSQES